MTNLPTLVNLSDKSARQLENMLAAAHAFGSVRTIERIEAEVSRREALTPLPWATLPQPANA